MIADLTVLGTWLFRVATSNPSAHPSRPGLSTITQFSLTVASQPEQAALKGQARNHLDSDLGEMPSLDSRAPGVEVLGRPLVMVLALRHRDMFFFPRP